MNPNILMGNNVSNPGSMRFNTGVNSGIARSSLQNALMGLKSSGQGITRNINQQTFNTMNTPGALAYVGLGVNALNAGEDVYGAAKRKANGLNYYMPATGTGMPIQNPGGY